jgi:hypothetical protein
VQAAAFSAFLASLNQYVQNAKMHWAISPAILNQEIWMKKIILFVLVMLTVTVGSAQEVTPGASWSPAPTVSNSTPATAADMEALRQQVQSLTETVKALQEQVKDQQAALQKANLTGESGLPQNPEPSPIAGAEESPAPLLGVARHQ